MTITNNLFLNNSTAVDVNGQNDNRHTAYINNNTIVDSIYEGIRLQTYATSTVTAAVANNIIVGITSGFGIEANDYSGGLNKDKDRQFNRSWPITPLRSLPSRPGIGQQTAPGSRQRATKGAF